MSLPKPILNRSLLSAAFLVISMLLSVPRVSLAQDPAASAAGQNMAEFSEVGQQAFAQFEQGDYSAAIATLEGAYKAGQVTHVDRALLGTLYLDAGKPEEALAAFKVVADTETADPAVLYNAGRAALALGKSEIAEQYLERSVAKVPLSPAARMLGLLRSSQGRVTEAFRLLSAWVANNQADGEARVALIAAGLQINRAAEVGPLFDGLPTDNPRVQLLRGQFMSQTGDTAGAIGLFERLRETAPEPMRRNLNGLLSETYMTAGRFEDVVSLLSGQVEKDPRLALLLARGQEKSGDHQAAAATLKPFAESLLTSDAPTGPVASQVVTDYGRHLIAGGAAQEALPFLQQATKSRPRDVLAWKGLGEALQAVGRGDEAEAALAKFNELSEMEDVARKQAQALSEDPGAKAILQAQDAMTRGETQSALAILRQEVALSPADLRPRLLEIRLLMTLKRFPEALKSAESAVQRFPENPDALYQRGVIHMGLQDTAAAEKDLVQVLELAPDHIPAMNDLSVVLSLLGKKDEAKALLERLVELSPDNKLARDNLQKMRAGQEP